MAYLKKIILIVAFVVFWTSVKCQYIHTVAGTGVQGYNGDSIAATTAQLNHAGVIAFDRHKNLYICDIMNYRIRKVDSNGIITTYAGIGSPGFNGDSIPATSTLLTADWLTVDTMGNVFYPDANERIRKIDTNGIVTTVCGIGISGYNGDGIPATDAMIDIGSSGGMVIDKDGSIIFSDGGNNRIRKIDASTGYIYTVAGTGVSGYNGEGILATDAQIFDAGSPVFDTSGNLVFADGYNQRVRKIDRISGLISTILGTGIAGYNGDGLPTTATEISYAGGLMFDKNNNLFFCDGSNNRVRMVGSSDNLVHTIVGTGVCGFNGDGILATDAQICNPGSLVFDQDDNLVFSDGNNMRIRIINGTVGLQNILASRISSEISIFPNPASDYCSLTAATGQWLTNSIISIYDVQGKCLFRRVIDEITDKVSINTISWASGTYLVRVDGANISVQEKLVIEK